MEVSGQLHAPVYFHVAQSFLRN